MQTLNIDNLPLLESYGFHGGRESFVAFCKTIFASGQPRFLKTWDNRLAVFRHSDLRAMAIIPALGNVPAGVLSQRRAGDSAGGRSLAPDRPLGAAIADVFSNQFFFNNEPIHTPLRRMMLGQIGPKAIPQMEGLARSVVDGILAETPRGTTIDFARDIAEKLTVRFWGVLIGLTDKEMVALGALLQVMAPVFSFKQNRDAENTRVLDDAFASYGNLVEQAALRSLAAGDRPMVRALAGELAKLDLKDDPDCAGIVPRNAGAMLAGVLTDGFHTASVAAVNAIHTLSRHPEALAAVRATPSLMPAAIAEALRFESPVIVLNRQAIEDVEYDGLVIPKGTGVAMMWGAGNRDPQAFASPEVFDLTRNPMGHTTFGGGAQICPGRHAVAMLCRVLLEGLDAAGLQVVAVGDRSEWVDNYIMSQLRAFPARLAPRSVS